MTANDQIAELRSLQARADAIRSRLGIQPPGTVTFLADGCGTDERILVAADGYGGATLIVVEGNYPVDYVTKLEESFPMETAATEKAKALASFI
jgi:hypothetical protein